MGKNFWGNGTAKPVVPVEPSVPIDQIRTLVLELEAECSERKSIAKAIRERVDALAALVR